MNTDKRVVRQRPLHYFDVQVAVVEVRPGESNEAAWRRHVRQHPTDRQATVKIFNRRPNAMAEGTEKTRSLETTTGMPCCR